jgi:hypothetical protein
VTQCSRTFPLSCAPLRVGTLSYLLVARLFLAPQVAVLSIQAAGTGLTFTAASTVIFAEITYVPGHIQQVGLNEEKGQEWRERGEGWCVGVG